MSRDTKFNLKDKMDTHLIENETFLVAIMDMAELGRTDAEERAEEATVARFNAIMKLLTMYQERNSTFINSLYKPLDPKLYQTKAA